MWPITVNALEKYVWQQHNTVFFLVQQTVLTGFICFLAAFVPWFLSLYSNEQLLPSGGFAWWSFYFRQCKRVYLNEMTKASKPHNSLVLFCNMNRFARQLDKKVFYKLASPTLSDKKSLKKPPNQAINQYIAVCIIACRVLITHCSSPIQDQNKLKFKPRWN